VEETWAKSVYWVYGILLNDRASFNAAELSERLSSRGVETRPFFLGMHEQPVFRQMRLFGDERYPVAENLARKGLYLPSGLTLSESQVDHVVHALTEALSQ
jgi:perosamine synthetase